MKPILFNTEMVRAILDGRKTVTRRVVKFSHGQNPQWSGYVPDGAILYGSNNVPAAKAPYRPGDILYVRETWGRFRDKNYLYRAWPTPGQEPEKQDEAMKRLRLKWHPSVHMPREAARIFLRVTAVRVKRLRDMGMEDALKEGVIPTNRPGGCRCRFAFDGCMEEPCANRAAYEIERHMDPFVQLWDRTIKPADLQTYGWAANPWVWVIEFERITKEEANGSRKTI